MSGPCLAVYKLTLHRSRKTDDLMVLGETDGFLSSLARQLLKLEKDSAAILEDKSATHVKSVNFSVTDPHKNVYLNLRLSHGNYGYSADIFDTEKNQTVHCQTTKQASQRPHDILIASENGSHTAYMTICLPTGKSACFTFMRAQIESLISNKPEYNGYILDASQVSIAPVLDKLLAKFYAKKITATFDAPAAIEDKFKRSVMAVTGDSPRERRNTPIKVNMTIESGYNRRFVGGLSDFEAKRSEMCTTLSLPAESELAVTGTCADGKVRTFTLGDDNPIRTYMNLPEDCIGADGNPIREKVLEEAKKLVASLV